MVKIVFDLNKMNELRKEVTVKLVTRLEENSLSKRQIKELNKILK